MIISNVMMTMIDDDNKDDIKDDIDDDTWYSSYGTHGHC